MSTPPSQSRNRVFGYQNYIAIFHEDTETGGPA